jgi:putative metal-binding protein/FG-GAP repeat protein
MCRGRRALLGSVMSLVATLAGVRPGFALSDLLLIDRPEESRIAGRDGKDHAGAALAVGDVSGDGIGDMLIGVPDSAGISNTRESAGEVALVLGGPSLPLNLPIANAEHTFFGASSNANLGFAVAAGDVNADGARDVIMGAPKADAPGQGGAGAVYVFFGGDRLTGEKSVDLKTQHADLTFYGTRDGGRLGVAVAVGDFNGDGREDVAYSAPREGERFDRPRAGIVYIFFGTAPITPGAEITERSVGAVMTILGPSVDSIAGRALAAGDINGDGRDDLIINTVSTEAFGRIGSGDVYVVFGGPSLVPDAMLDLGLPTNIDLKIQGPLAGDAFGDALGAADVNGDTVEDILIGAPTSQFIPWVTVGRAYALFGRPFLRGTVVNLATDTADVTLAGPHVDAELGFSVAGGDMNGDAFAEWIVGAPGADRGGESYRILGRTTWSTLGVVGSLTQGAHAFDRAGSANVVGDVTGDGIGDLVMSAPFFEINPDDRRDQGGVYVIRGRDRDEVPSENCTDDDGDGFRRQGRTCGPQDCDDANPLVHPFQPEICDDGIDNDCDGFADIDGIDEDGDGWFGGPIGASKCVVLDCDDHNPTVNPAAPEICDDGVDNNCDGLVDSGPGICTVADEVCGNCVDDDKDGLIDILEPFCGMTSLPVKELTARRAKKIPTMAKKLLMKGAIFDAPQLTGDTVLANGLTVSLATSGGKQLCVALAKPKRMKDGTLVFKSAAKPRTVLRLKQKRDGRTKYMLQYKAPLELPAVPPMTLAVGLFPDVNTGSIPPYRATLELRTSGKSLIQGRVVQ